MKFLIVAVAFLACAYADVSELSGYNYPAPQHIAQPAPVHIPEPVQQPERQYIPPAPVHIPAPISVPENTYIPPAAAPANTYIPPAAFAPEQQNYEQPAEDGYRYKTVRRVVYRHRA